VNVTSADDVARKVKDNGGQVFMEPSTSGRAAWRCRDRPAPSSHLAAHQHKGAGLVNEPGTFSWTEL